jgi:hypothetical protein
LKTSPGSVGEPWVCALCSAPGQPEEAMPGEEAQELCSLDVQSGHHIKGAGLRVWALVRWRGSGEDRLLGTVLVS